MKQDDVKVIQARLLKSGQVELTFSQIKRKPESAPNILAMVNPDDDRFNQAKPRQAWLNCQKQVAETIVGKNLDTLNEVGDTIELDVLNPEFQGIKFAIQVVETTNGTPFELENAIDRAKQVVTKNDGTKYFVTADNKPIYSHTTVVSKEHVRDSYIPAENSKMISPDEFSEMLPTQEEVELAKAAVK